MPGTYQDLLEFDRLCFSRAYGTNARTCTRPAPVELAGYYQRSLRDPIELIPYRNGDCRTE
jgi:hypothetical protein